MRVAIEAESLEKKARLHKALDQWEESRIPAVTLHPRELRFERPPLPAGPGEPTPSTASRWHAARSPARARFGS